MVRIVVVACFLKLMLNGGGVDVAAVVDYRTVQYRLVTGR
jgi:hypothetical protein